MWFEKKKKFVEGVKTISTNMTDEKFKDSLIETYRRFRANEDFDILHFQKIDGNILFGKTILYIVQRLSLFLMSPVQLQNDLTSLELSLEKSEIVVNWYNDCNREIIKSLSESSEDFKIYSAMKTILYDSANLKCKKQVACLHVKTGHDDLTLDGLNNSSLVTLFENFETIQRELDILSLIK